MASELYNRTAWARVEATPGVAEGLWTSLGAATTTDKGPGLSQGEAVQVAVELATLRDLVAAWGYARIIGFPEPGATVDPKQARYVEAVGAKQIETVGNAMAKAGLRPTFVVGDAPFFSLGPAGDTPIAGWGRKLALALDRVLVTIGDAEQGATEQPRAVPGFLPVAAIPLAIVVTGAALSIIGSIATWRFLDPDVRRDGLLVRQAGEDYAKRLQVFQTTGKMLDPTPLEASATATVERLAKARSSTDWGMAAAVAGGITAGTIALGLLSYRRAA